MQKAFAPTSSEAAGLIREAMERGHVVIIPASDRRATPASAPRSDSYSSLVATCCLLFKLAPAEARAFAALLEHNHVSREALHAAIAHGAPATNIKSIDVVVHKLRKKLARHNIRIDAIWGQGFTIDKTTRDRVRKLIAESGADVVDAATPREIPAD